MSETMKDKILEEITEFYLSSGDFNGIPMRVLKSKLDAEWEDLRPHLEALINEDKICVLDPGTDINPHVMRIGYEPKDKQIAKLENPNSYHTCFYPLPKHLEQVVDSREYAGRPYELELALGAPQLAHRAFDLSILEFYRNDPRYYYQNDDIRGNISIHDEYYETEQMAESDQILLQTFGFCYDDDLNRAVAVYVRYLADLSPEHQQIWKAKELSGDYKIHPDYYRNTIHGAWGERISLFDAFLIELQVINRMCDAMGKPPLFRDDFSEDKPRGFGFLVRPTLKAFNDFVMLLDKMISENLNKKFFEEDVAYETEEERKDGKVIVRHKGTLTLLEEWLKKYFRPADPEPVEEMIQTFKHIRKLRQKPAHAINENVFDQKYIHEQRELMLRAYESVRTLRLILANHPKVKATEIEIDPHVKEGKIWQI